MLQMMRSFLPVGQGAFYCEQFDGLLPCGEKINIVYDCGSSTDVKLVEEQIRVTFDRNETIHAVFISHLHDDHVNGLEYLLRYCNVKNIFFPLMYREDKTILTLNNLINGVEKDSFVNLFINNPYNALDNLHLSKSRPNLFKIAYQEQVRDENITRDDIRLVEPGENVWDKILYGSKMKNRVDDWLYIPFNFRHTDRIAFLQEALFKEFGYIEDLNSFWVDSNVYTKDRIKEIYRKIPGGYNVNSMTLYSGPVRHHKRQIAHPYYLHPCCFCYCSKPSGCLYTGDYDASGEQKIKSLKSSYYDLWENIGCLQIPHHGSRHNYNSEFSTLNSFFVISAGRSNRYRHPHSKVVKNLMFNNRYPFIVTEDSASAVYLVVD